MSLKKSGIPQDTSMIDLNNIDKGMNVQKQGAGVSISFDPAMVARIRRDGLRRVVPVIVDMRALLLPTVQQLLSGS